MYCGYVTIEVYIHVICYEILEVILYPEEQTCHYFANIDYSNM